MHDEPKNCINRIIRRQRGFTQVANATLRDNRLSYRARGILAMVLSHADSWVTSQHWIVENGAEGREAIRTALAELEAHGYLVREKARDRQGRIIGHRMTWTEEPEPVAEPEQPPAPRPVPPPADWTQYDRTLKPFPEDGNPSPGEEVSQKTGSPLVDKSTCGESPPSEDHAEQKTIQKPEYKAAARTKKEKVTYTLDFHAAAAVQLDLTCPPEIKRLWTEYQGYRADRHHATGKRCLAWTERAARMAAEAINHASLAHPEQMIVDRIRTAIEKDWKGLGMDNLGKPQFDNNADRPQTNRRPSVTRNTAPAEAGSYNDLSS